MAYINATLWNDLQLSQATNEKRFPELGLVNAVKESTKSVDYIPPSAMKKMQELSSLRALEIPVLKDQTVTVVTTPGFAQIPGNLPESDKYEFTAYDVFSGFRHYPGAHDNNMVDSDWQREQVMLNVAHAMGNSIESVLATQMEARKTQQLGYTVPVSQGDGTFSFSTVTDTLTVNKAAQKETMFFNLSQLMEANEIPGAYRIVTSRAGLAVQMSEAAKYAANNEKNLQALGFLDSSRIHKTGNISNGSDVFSGYFLRDGAIGMIGNHPYDFRKRTKVGESEWKVSDVEIPFTRMRANIYTNRAATDGTALIEPGTDTNLIMGHFEEMAIWIRFYVVYRYNSDLANRVNDIVKVVGSTS